MHLSHRTIAIICGVLIIAVILIFGSRTDSKSLPEGIVQGNGRLEAVQIDIATKLSGRLEQVAVREGDLVKQGDSLAWMDSSELKARLLRAEADVASAESMVAQAQAQIAQSSAHLKLAEKELERATQLLQRGHTSQETYDTRLSTRDVAKANLAASNATLVARERGVDAAIAVRKEIETQINDCKLTSPTLGRVLYRLSEPGEVLPAGGKIVTLVNLAEVYMEIYLPAADAHRLAIGSEARIVIDGADFAVPAKVTFVSPEAQFTPKQVETATEREKLMFRIKVRVPTELIQKNVDFVKTGIRGMAYVRPGFNPPDWPEWLEKRFVPPPQKTTGS